MQLPKGLARKAFTGVATIAAGAGLLMGLGQGTASAEGFCATDNGIQHCETASPQAAGFPVWMKYSISKDASGRVIQSEYARYEGVMPPNAVDFLPHWNGHSIDKAVGGPGCLFHS